jgi:galactokinase
VNNLRSIYGEGAPAQAARYQQAVAAFNTAYPPAAAHDELFVFRAPGRVNLIGEHTDYNQGYVLPAALDRDILLIARPRNDACIRLADQEAGYAPVDFVAGPDIPPEERGHWGNYARAAAQALARRRGQPLRGMDGLVAGAAPYGVPRGAGLSSSSALTVVTAVALAYFNDWRPEGPEKMAFARFCAEAEWYVGTRGGIMDHFAALLTHRDHALFLDCRPNAEGCCPTEDVPLPAGYRLIVVDSGVHHENARGQFNERVAACRAGVGLLRTCYPTIAYLRDVQDTPWDELEPQLPEEITPEELRQQGVELNDLPGLDHQARLRVRARCRHVGTENRRVLEAVAALRAGHVETLGRLLNEAHASARDDYEISCPELECLVSAAREVEGVEGARLTGAGWGGCILAQVRADAVLAFQDHVSRRYQAETGVPPHIFACRAGPGAGKVDM